MVRSVAVAFLATLALAGATFAQCPPNYVGANLHTPGGTPIFAAAHRDSACVYTDFCQWKSQWDNRLGTAHLFAGNVPCPGETGGSVEVGQYTSDDFVITGAAGPSPVSFQVILYLTGTSNRSCRYDPQSNTTVCSASGSITASLGDGTQTSSTGQVRSFTSDLALSTSLVLTLSRLVGEHFHLDRSLYVDASCAQSTNVTSQLQIIPPSGYSVTSCDGFTASGPTATLPASWGGLKARYR